MSSEWQLVRLGDLVTLKGGFAYKGEYLGSGAARLLGMGVVSHSERFLKNGVRRYDGEFSASYKVGPGDIVIATRQQSDNLPILGCPAIVPTDLAGADVVVGTNLYKVANDSDVNNNFLYWLLRGNEYRNRILECSKGTTVRMITKDAIENFTFLCPPANVRSEVANFLDALDDRITLLRETNATLEAIAQALFKSWFVDFDPVRAKMEGRVPEGMDEATAALFPDGFEESELGTVPKGWLVSSLGTQCNLGWGNTTITKKSYVEHGFRAYSAAGQDGFVEAAERSGVGSVISAIGTVGVVHLATGKWTAIKNTLTAQCSTDGESAYLHYLLKRIKFPSRGSTQQFISQGDARSIRVLCPPVEVRMAFGAIAIELVSKLVANEEMVESLAELRDTLLPRLISGQLRLPEAQAERETADAVGRPGKWRVDGSGRSRRRVDSGLHK